MSPEHKIWAVVDAIEETMVIAPVGGDLEIDPKELEKIMTSTEIGQVFQKLETDEKVIKILNKPGDLDLLVEFAKDNKIYRVRIPSLEAFGLYYDRAHYKFFSSLEKLNGEIFFAVADITLDIADELATLTSNELTIPLRKDIIRYKILYPSHSPNFMDRYCDLRMKGIEYLKENGHIRSFKLNPAGWDSTVDILIDRMTFTRFYKRLVDIYPKKVQPEDDEEEKVVASDGAAIEQSRNRDIQMIAIKKILEDAEKEEKMAASVAEKVAEKLEEAGVIPATLNLPAGTKWEDITIQFIDGENVRIFGPNDFTVEASYKEMGFQNNKAAPRKPNKQWSLLHAMAGLVGRISWEDKQADDRIKKAKQLLSEGLRNYFGIKEDPFYSYKKEKGYQLKLQLMAEVGAPTARPTQRAEDDGLGIEEELQKLTAE